MRNCSQPWITFHFRAKAAFLNVITKKLAVPAGSRAGTEYLWRTRYWPASCFSVFFEANASMPKSGLGIYMVEVELQVTSNQRVGLLISLSQVLIANGFSLARQRMAETAEGILLTLVARGPEPNVPSLQRSIEGQANVQAVQVVSLGPIGGSATNAASPPSARPAEGPPATARIEALLPQLARAYPNIFPALLPFERELPAEQREPTLFQMGERVGAWVYKRDYAMGGQLPLGDSLRRIVQPALRQLVNAEVQDATIRVGNSPFCNRGEPGACCHFLRGMLGGLVGGKKGAGSVRVIESACRNIGADACVFAFQDS